MYFHTTVDTPAVFLVATEERIIQIQPFDDGGSDGWRKILPNLEISGATVLDVDVMENKIYWINEVEKVSALLYINPYTFINVIWHVYLLYLQRIYRLSRTTSQSDGLELECVVCCCVESPADLAVDWYGRNLYWTDSELRTIEISKLDGSERSIFAIIPPDLGAPSLITVDPVRG